jgi:hypothetical protein
MALSMADRTDNTEVVAQVDNFLKLVEAKMNRALIAQKMSIILNVPCTGAEFYTLPADYLSLKDIHAIDTATLGNKATFSYLSQEQIANAAANVATSYYYALVNNVLQVYPKLDATKTLVLTYFSRLVPLTSIATSNWMSIYNPDCYVFGLLAQINIFVKDYEAGAAWNAQFKETLGDIDFQDSKSTWSGPALTTKRG